MAERGEPNEGARSQLTPTALPLAALLLSLVGGCAGYEKTARPLHNALVAGRVKAALDGLNTALRVDRAEDRSAAIGPDTPLILLERATLLQALGNHDLSARDFQAADANLKVLDVDADEVGAVMRYFWSDSSGLYRAPPFEKALLNTMNMLNYLALGDLSGARVEARRLNITEHYLAVDEADAPLLALGAYLSGFTYERSGRYREAMRYYADADERGGVPSLDAATQRLHRRTGAWDPRLGDAPKEVDVRGLGPGDGEVLVVVGTGRVPYKRPDRLPLALAVAHLTAPGCVHCLTAKQRTQAATVTAQGMLSFLNRPVMERVRAHASSVEVALGGSFAPGGSALDTEAVALGAFARIEGLVLLSAFTRMVTRALAGGATTAAVKAMGQGKDGDLLAFLAGLAVQGAMVAADVPDTRSWVSLPGQFHVFRATVAPGPVAVRIKVGGQMEVNKRVQVPPAGFAVVTHWTLR